MATLVLGAIGTLIGGPIGGSIGALIGRSVDTKLFGGGSREGPRLTELKLSSSSYGTPLPRHFGRMRAAGQIIWATELVEHKEKQGGGKGSPSVTSYAYTASFAVALSSRPVLSLGRIWADGKLLRGEGGDLKTGGTLRLYHGTGDQPADPLIAAAEGADLCPAYRGLAYVVFEDLQLADFGNRIPSLSFEIIADQSELHFADLLEGVIADHESAVPLPGIAGLANEGPLIEALAALDPFYPVDCDACDDALVLAASDSQTAAVALPEPATSTDPEAFGGNAGFTRERGGTTEGPVAVLRYYDIDRDYQPGAQRASGRPLPGQPRTVELPAALAAGAARQAIERAAKRASWGRQTVSWRVTQLDPAVRPGAQVVLPDHAGRWRVNGWEWRQHGIDLTLTRLAPGSGPVLPVADPGRTNPPPDLLSGPTMLLAAELPWDGQSITPVPLILAWASSAGPGWNGASLYVDHGDGALLPLGPTGRNRATIGIAASQLAPASPLLYDRERQVDVVLAGPDLQLTDATMPQLAMGANRALLGEELIQFAHAEPLGAGLWRLSGLWRGCGGTEHAVASHQIGEGFALLDGAGIPLAGEAVGAVPGTMIVAVGLGDMVPVAKPIAMRGIAYRPPSPVHANWSRNQSGGDLLRWTRRARGGWRWLDAVDVPLGEQVEAYEITFGINGTVSARWERSEPVLTLDTGELAALLASQPGGGFTIRQRGDRALSDAVQIDPPMI